MSAKIIAMANQKGGVAKTTSTYNLAAAKAKAGQKVLMIDLDPQANLTAAAGIRPGSDDLEGMSTCFLFEKQKNDDPSACVFSVPASGLDTLFIIPSHISLAKTESLLVANRNSDVQLRKSTQQLRENYDYIFIDCPPQLGTLLINALTASDLVIVPVKTDYLGLMGLQDLFTTIEGVTNGDGDRSLNPDLEVVGVIATLHKRNSNDHKEILSILERNYKVLGVIADKVAVNKGLPDGLPVVLTEPDSEEARSYTAIADMI